MLKKFSIGVWILKFLIICVVLASIAAVGTNAQLVKLFSNHSSSRVSQSCKLSGQDHQRPLIHVVEFNEDVSNTVNKKRNKNKKANKIIFI